MEHLIPFYIASGAAGTGAVARIPGPNGTINGCLELNVIVGGPVFLWRGRKEAQEAYGITHGGDPDFDLAASAEGDAKVEIEGNLELLTLHSDNETIGFVKITVYDNHNETVDQLKELIKVMRNGISIPHTTT